MVINGVGVTVKLTLKLADTPPPLIVTVSVYGEAAAVRPDIGSMVNGVPG